MKIMIRMVVITVAALAGTNLHGDTRAMTDESDRAYVGQSSRSTGITTSPAVEMAFERALAAAKSRSDARLSTEHVLIELLDEESTRELFSASSVDVDGLRTSLRTYLDFEIGKSTGGADPKPDEALQNAMLRAVMKSFMSNKKRADGADLVVAFLVEDDSFSAKVLRDYGLTAESAENANLERYLARSKEQASRFEDLRKAQEQRESTAGRAQLRISTATAGSAPQIDDVPHKTYKLRITNDDAPEDHTQFKAALSRNGILDLYIEETPFEIEFVASTIVGLFETVNAGDRLKVELVTELDGQNRTVSGFSGSAGAIFRDPRDRMGQRSGLLD